MNKSHLLKWHIAAVMACMALIILASSAPAALTVTTTNQNGALPFTPSWTPSPDSLIAGLAPSATAGNFNLDNTNCNVNSLTSGGSLTINTTAGNNPAGPDPVGNTTTSSNYVTCGNRTGAPAAGSLIVYSLPASANGYNLTNITVYGGWADSGRDGQAFTVLYSTVANPNSFTYLTTVNYNPTVPGSTPSANREVINDSLGGVIAANVAAVEFDFTVPHVENGWAGYGAITVGGTEAASVVSPVVSITTENQSGTAPFTPAWTPESPSLIAGLTPTTAAGNFTQESSGDTPVLTDGVMGESGTVAGFATCGTSGGGTLIYTLTNSPNGSDVTNIVLYSGWGNADRDGQYYTLSYSTVSAPTIYIPITTVFYNPQGVVGASANRVEINTSTGVPLAGNVASLKFDFSTPPSANNFDNGYQGYSEIIVQGQDSAPPTAPPSAYLTQDTLPARAETFVGDQVVFTAAYSNTPPVIPQWQQITTALAATNDINVGVVNVTNNGVVTSTLTLNDVQLADAGSYRLAGFNATNSSATTSYSTEAPLAVSAPATLGNVVAEYSGQTGPTGVYTPWATDTNADLIFGFSIGAGNAIPGAGNFSEEVPLNFDPSVLSDGNLNSDKTNMVSCGWVQVGAGQSMTYSLPSSSYGYNITNIAVYGGWSDDGRNEQKYQVLYSTASASGPFVSIGTFDYNPSFSDGSPNATRTILVPVSGYLAQNAVAVQINFNMSSKNNWNGYSEITVGGTPALGIIPSLTQDITPNTAEDVVGGQLIMTGAFSGADGYQWQKDGTDLVGQTTPTLTVSDLQPSDAATNGGYRLLAYNAYGTNMTRGCTVVVDPVPAATNNVVTSVAYQTSDTSASGSFTPTWDTSTLGMSLIAGENPPGIDYGPGNFNDPDVNYPGTAGGLPVLTDYDYGYFYFDGSHPAFACGGPNAGQYVIYSLGADANGYNITNIQVAGGWNDNGRNSQYYTVLYSTAANTNMFIPLASVANNLTGYGVNDATTVRTTFTPATGVLASNAYAIKVDFIYPAGVPNGYSGYSQISVFGSPSATPPPSGPVITASHEETNNNWTVESPNLIADQLPSSQGAGVFTDEGCNVTNLTDGVIGFGYQYGASCGGDGTAVPWIIFSPANGGGWDLTNIVVYTLWNDYGREGQFYNVSYSTLSAPTTFLPLAGVAYNPYVPSGVASGNRVAIAPSEGQTVLASNVAALKFDFTPQGTQDFGWSGYSEIVLQGSYLAPPTPLAFANATVSGGNLILTGGGGAVGGSYTLLTTTNLLTPLTDWTTNSTGVFDSSGAFSNAIPVDASKPTSYFRLRNP